MCVMLMPMHRYIPNAILLFFCGLFISSNGNANANVPLRSSNQLFKYSNHINIFLIYNASVDSCTQPYRIATVAYFNYDQWLERDECIGFELGKYGEKLFAILS